MQPLDGVHRAAARMIGGIPKFGHINDFIRDTPHWLLDCVSLCLVTVYLPSELRSLPQDLSSSFYKLHNTFIFDQAWAGSASEYLP